MKSKNKPIVSKGKPPGRGGKGSGSNSANTSIADDEDYVYSTWLKEQRKVKEGKEDGEVLRKLTSGAQLVIKKQQVRNGQMQNAIRVVESEHFNEKYKKSILGKIEGSTLALTDK